MDIIYILKYIVLGIIEGLTEFLPISSTGHLIIATDLLGIESDEFNKFFLIIVQLFAIFAVLILYWPRIWQLLKGIFAKEEKYLHFLKIWIIGCIPAAVLGLLFNDLIDKYLFSVPTVAFALLVGALLMLFGERKYQFADQEIHTTEITTKQAWQVGLFQCLALWPGFSRSASTIMGGWFAGLNTATAADFSFFLAIPIMFGASGYSCLKYLLGKESVGLMSSTQWGALILGCLASFVVAWLVVKGFLKYLQSNKLAPFAWYRLALAILLFVLILAGFFN